MRIVGIRTLKNKLSEYLRMVQSGETILITDHDRVVAELHPIRESRSPILGDALLADAVRKGWLTPAVLQSSEAPPFLPVAPIQTILEGLNDDRSDR
jgi:prevent-host-death family protein